MKPNECIGYNESEITIMNPFPFKIGYSSVACAQRQLIRTKISLTVTIHNLGIFDNLGPGVNFINCLVPYAKILLHKKILKSWAQGPNDQHRVGSSLFMKSTPVTQNSNIFTGGDRR